MRMREPQQNAASSAAIGPSAFARGLRWFVGAALALVLGVFLFAILVDPYGANPLRLRFERPLMDINQRFMYPQVLRSGEFDSAVFGTSTIRLLRPADLEKGFGGHFANFGMNAGTPFEQSEAVRLYLAHMPKLRTLVWGIDPSWCFPDADEPDKRLTERAFPPWLYDGNGFATIPHLFNLRTLEISTRVVMNRLGLMKARLPRDGYEVFTPPEAAYDLARARAHIWSGNPHQIRPVEPPFVLTPEQRSGLRFPALDRMAATLAALPEGAQLVLLFPPVHVAIQPVPGSPEAAFEAECRGRVAAIAAAHQGLTVDFRFASPITGEDANYWDPLHFRLPIARRVAEALGQAREGVDQADFRVLRGGS
ncbi:hypothetical protein SAMN05519103_00252 [Rhizobiales bacterium GAS113]|nr:hypothetical protein SAMN05519103_00252 [Rhizobiales bacterium GAS113]